MNALQKALALAAEIAAKEGVELAPVESIPDPVEYMRQEEAKKEERSLAFEGVLLQAHSKHALMMKKCRVCGHAFQTSYCYVSFCSDLCRKEEFRQRFHVDFDRLKPPASFWEYEKEILVPPDTLTKLYGWAKELVRQYEAMENGTMEVPNPPWKMDQDQEVRQELRQSAEEHRTEYLVDQATETLGELTPGESSPAASTLEVPGFQQVEISSTGDILPATPQSTPDIPTARFAALEW